MKSEMAAWYLNIRTVWLEDYLTPFILCGFDFSSIDVSDAYHLIVYGMTYCLAVSSVNGGRGWRAAIVEQERMFIAKGDNRSPSSAP